MENKVASKEIHLTSGFVMEDDFELVEVKVPKVEKEGEFLVRNIWMTINPFLRIYIWSREVE